MSDEEAKSKRKEVPGYLCGPNSVELEDDLKVTAHRAMKLIKGQLYSSVATSPAG